MTTKLKNLKITEGSLVDKGANEEAEVVLFKRDEVLNGKNKFEIKQDGIIEKIKQTFKKFFDNGDEARNFNQVLDEKERFQELWDIDEALRISVNSILHDDDLTALEKQSKVAETLTQYLQELMSSGIIKIGRKISGGRMSVLKELMNSMTKAVSELEGMLTDIEGTQKGANMPISDEVRQNLPDEVKAELDSLEKSITEKDTEIETSKGKVDELTTKVEGLEKSDKTDEDKKDEILKGASDEVIAKMDELQKQVDSANEIAKSEKESRITKEYEDKAKELPNIVGTVEEIAKQLRVADEGGIGEQVHKQLKAMNEQAKTILKESGSANAGGVGGDAYAKIDAKASEIAKSENISKEQAEAKFLATDEGKALYAESERMVN